MPNVRVPRLLCALMAPLAFVLIPVAPRPAHAFLKSFFCQAAGEWAFLYAECDEGGGGGGGGGLWAGDDMWLTDPDFQNWGDSVLPDSDPVAGSGHLRYRVPLLSFKAPGLDFAVTATYNSAISKRLGVLGRGWDLSLNQRLLYDPERCDKSRIFFNTGDASSMAFSQAGPPVPMQDGLDTYLVTRYLPDFEGSGFVLEKRELRNIDDYRTEWVITDATSVRRYFDDAYGYLTRIVSPSGNAITLTWKGVAPLDPNAQYAPNYELVTAEDSAHRIYYFNYYDPATDPPGVVSIISQEGKVGGRFLKCISAAPDPECWDPLVSFEVDRNYGPSWGALAAISDPNRTGQVFVYDTEVRFPVPYVPDDDVDRICDSYCGDADDHICDPVCDKVVASQHFCDDLPKDEKLCRGFCYASWREYSSPDVAWCWSECDNPDGGSPGVVPQAQGGNCFPGEMERCVCNSVISGSGIGFVSCDEPQRVCRERLANLAFCTGLDPADDGKRASCRSACAAHFAAQKPADSKVYGDPSDLLFNLTEVYSQDGTLVIKNWYGADELSPDFDKVILQQLGPQDPNDPDWKTNHLVRFEYHDLDAERATSVVSNAARRLPNQAVELQYALASPKLYAERTIDQMALKTSLYATDVTLASQDYAPLTDASRDITWTAALPVESVQAFSVAQADVSLLAQPIDTSQAIEYLGGEFGLGFNDDYGRYVDNLANYVPWSICQATARASTAYPGWPLPGPLAESTYAPATPVVLGPNQIYAPGVLPAWAVVTYANGNAITQYYRSSAGDALLREVNHHLTDKRAATSTEYAYTNGFRTGVREPNGIRMCSQVDDHGRPLEVVSLPAPGKLGNTPASDAHFYYDARGDLVLSATTARTLPLKAVATVRDSAGRVTSSVTQVAKGVFRTTRNDYPDVASRAYDFTRPASLALTHATQLPANVRTDYFDYDPSGQARRVVANATSLKGPPVTTVATYDGFGRLLTSGREARGYHETEYDLGGRPLAARTYLAPKTAPIETVYEYGPNDDSPWPVVARDAKVEHATAYDAYGHVVATRDTARQTGGTRNHCYRVRISDGKVLEEVLPEGGMLRSTLDDEGHVTRIERGFPAKIPAWAAWCSDNLGKDPNKVPGFETTFEATYDASGILTRTVEGGVETFYERDGFGRVIEYRNALGERTRSGYDDAGRTAWNATYTAKAGAYAKPVFGDPALVAAAETAYDMLDRPVSAARWHFDGPKSLSGNALDPRETKTFVYDDAQMFSATVDNGRAELTMHDGAGRTVAACMGVTCTVWSTPAGARADLDVSEYKFTPAGFNNTTRVYDTLGRLIVQHDGTVAARPLAAHFLEVDGTEDGSWTNDGGFELYARDSFGHVLTATRLAGGGAVNGKTSYEWDAEGRTRAVLDGADHRTERHFDGLGRLAFSIDAIGRATKYDYWLGSERARHMTDPAGTTREAIFDVAGRLVTEHVTHGAGLVFGGQTTTRTYTYSPLGLIESATLGDNAADPMNGTSVGLHYDSLGNRLTDAESRWPTLVVSHTYDRYGAQLTTTLGGTTTRYGYQPDGRLASVGYETQPVATLAYTGGGGPAAIYYGAATAAKGGLTQLRTYDRLGYLTGVTVDLRAPAGAVNPVLLKIASERDAVTVGGLALARQRTFANAASMTDVFRVDANGRVTAENLRLANVALPALGTYANAATFGAYLTGAPTQRSLFRTLAWDASDLWTDLATGDAGKVHADRDAFGQVTGYNGAGSTLAGVKPSYDDASNVSQLGALGAYTFDGIGRPITSSRDGAQRRFLYDALGRRVAEQDLARGTTTVFVWDGDRIVAWGLTDDKTLGILSTQLTRRLMTGPHSAIALVRREADRDVIRYVAQSPDGSVLALFDASGLIEGSAYSAFGDLALVDAGGAPTEDPSKLNRFYYQGALYQPHTKTYLMGAREYAPELLSWLSPDPGGVASDGPNLYGFVGARPLQFGDPSGFERVSLALWDMNTSDTTAVEATPDVPEDAPSAPDVPVAGKDGEQEAQLPEGLPETLDELFPGGSEGVRLETLLGFVPPHDGMFTYEDPATHTRINFNTERAFSSFYGMLDSNDLLTHELDKLFAKGQDWNVIETEDINAFYDGVHLGRGGATSQSEHTIYIAPGYGADAREFRGLEYDYNEVLAHELGHAIEGHRADWQHGDYSTRMGDYQREGVDGFLDGRAGHDEAPLGWTKDDEQWLILNDFQQFQSIARELRAYREAGIPWSDVVPPPPPRH